MAYSRLNLKNGDILSAEHLNHIEDAICSLSDVSETSKNEVRLCLPSVIRWEVNKPLYIFKHAITTAFNYENYNIQVLMSKSEKDGKDRHRYFMYTPQQAEENILTFKLYDNAQNLLDTKQVTLKVVVPGLPANKTTVFFIGDSLVYYNRITDEFSRIMTSSDSATTVDDTISIYKVYKPAGRGSTNVNLIGTQKQNYKGWQGKTYHEGRSGWQWSNFLGTSSPFYNSSTKSLDFNKYFSARGAVPNVIYIGLGWNDTRTIPIDDSGVINTTTLYNNAKSFLTQLTTQVPTAKIRLWTQNVPGRKGGIGAHVYGATGWSDEHRLKLFMLAMCETYETLAKEFENVEVVWTTCMIDSEFALQESESSISYRTASTEVLGVDYVHPADAGFFQIADGIVSDFMHCLGATTDEEIDYEDVEATEIDFYTSGSGNAVMYYQDVFKYFNNATLDGWGANIIISDVSQYRGKQIKIKAATSVQASAYYAMFTSKLPTGLTTIEALSTFTATGYSEDKTDMLTYFNISTIDKTARSIVVTVPDNAQYLTFTNLSNYFKTPFIGVVID